MGFVHTVDENQDHSGLHVSQLCVGTVQQSSQITPYYRAAME